jgi:hypothetical protein
VAAAHALKEVAERHPAERDRVVALLAAAMTRPPGDASTAEADPADDPDGDVRGFAMSYLIDLRAVEHAEAMRSALAAGSVDKMICGDWDDVQEQLGLKPARPERPLRAWLTRGQRAVLGKAVGPALPRLDAGGRPG